MKRLKGFVLAAMVLFAAALLPGCGDSGSTDTVWIPPSGLALKGSVYTEDNGPAEGAVVHMIKSASVASVQGVVGEDGNFVIYSLEKDVTYTLYIAYEGYREYTAQVTMDASKTLGRITLIPAGEPVYAVSGRILLETGGPEADLTEATVYLVVDGEEIPAYETQPDGSGNYLFEGVEAGSYTVVVMGLAGYADNDDTDIEVVDADVAVDDITMIHGFTVGGRVFFDSGMPDPNSPATGVYVVFTQQISPTEWQNYSALIDENGDYVTPVMEHGQWTMALALDEDGERTFYEDATPIDLTSGNVTDHDVSLTDNAANITGYIAYGEMLYNLLPATTCRVELTGDGGVLLAPPAVPEAVRGFYAIVLAESEIPVSLVNWNLTGHYPGFPWPVSLNPADDRITYMPFSFSE